MRLFATSDLHTDYKENFRWLEQISDSDYRDDALIVAGDISDRLEVVRDTFKLLRSRFRYLLFTPGNHELWVRDAEYDSIEKLRRVLELCAELEVSTSPVRFEEFWVVPLFSWYDGVFDPELKNERSARQAWADFHFCKWPSEATPLPEYFLSFNKPYLKTYDAPVVTFSHFLPRADLLPPKEYLRISWLGSVSVCAALDGQIREIDPVVHVCGHTHTRVDNVIDGIHYVQNAVRYPKERTTASIPIKQIL
jgi:hypothetical protein